MKRILAAVDFSKGSIHALHYAGAIAEKLGAGITMVWVDSDYGIAAFGTGPDNEYRNEAIRNFKEQVAWFKKEKPTVSIDYKLRRGKVYKEIALAAQQMEADLIIAGTHGVTGFQELWIGSNAYRIVSYATCPVITVRYDFFTDGSFESIVLPIDSTSDTRQKVPFTCEMAKQLNARLHIVGLNNTCLKTMQKKMQSNVDSVVKYLRQQGVGYDSTEITTDDVTKTLIDYASQVDADLIAIMTEQDRSASSLLLGPQAQQLVNYSKVPVLSIQPKEVTNTLLR